ncbi:MAG: DegT/DnrJ/EryC1/StrS family aminotransferase [Candidatus Sulfotelmatobacter sp.]
MHNAATPIQSPSPLPAQSSVPARDLIVQIEPWIDDAELRQLKRVIDSTFLVEHDLTREFEAMTAALAGSKHAMAVCNGSMALFVCLKALGIGPGDEVIVPNLTFVATANAVILAGATPVLCEVREDTFCLDAERAGKLISRKTRALLPVHLYGQSADMAQVMALARCHNLKVIEDAAEGIGVTFEGRHVGSFGDMGILSYYGNKTITCGEGGMVLTDDNELAKAAYRLKNYGRDQKGTFVHESIGFNFSFTDLQAAIGIAQMKKLPAIIRRKREIHDRYADELGSVAGLRPVFIDPRCQPVFWFTSFLCEDPDALSTFLCRHNIQTRRFFCPLHLQPCYADGKHVQISDPDFRISERIYRQGISLPSSYSLTAEQQAFVIEKIQCFYADRN